jgi:hypothetical protein
MMERTPEQKKPAKEEPVTLTVSHDDDAVVMHFPLQNMKFGVPPEVAVQVALALIRHAEAIEQEAA